MSDLAGAGRRAGRKRGEERRGEERMSRAEGGEQRRGVVSGVSAECTGLGWARRTALGSLWTGLDWTGN